MLHVSPKLFLAQCVKHVITTVVPHCHILTLGESTTMKVISLYMADKILCTIY